MTIHHLKQSVISRATRANKPITLPRVFQIFDQGDQMMLVWFKNHASGEVEIFKIDISYDDWISTWQLFINELYEKVEDNG